MNNLGFNAFPLGFGIPPAGPRPAAPGFAQFDGFGGGFDPFASVATASPFGGERFVSSSTGGVILGKDGEPSGRVPQGSFVDTQSGKLYGPDGKAITLPEGATVDFFDLPDLDQLMNPTATATAGGPGGKLDGPPGKFDGVLAASDSGCGMDDKMQTGVAGASGGGTTPALMAQLQQGLTSMPGMPGMAGMTHSMYPPALPAGYGGVLGGGLTSAVGGANGLGTIPSLQSSLMELVATLRELTAALQDTVRAGGPAGPAPKGKTEEPPAVPTPDSTPATTDSSSSSTTTTTTATTAVQGASGSGTTDSTTSDDDTSTTANTDSSSSS